MDRPSRATKVVTIVIKLRRILILSVVAASVGRVLTTLAVENYRSLRNLVLPLSRLTVVTAAALER